MSFLRTWAASRATKAATGFRSPLEVELARALTDANVPFEYETLRIPYFTPTFYKPDFALREQAIIIETKGAFQSTDRSKMLRIKDAHPDLDIRFLFNNPNTRLGKLSKTTYGMWCAKHGFLFAKGGTPPPEWLAHKPSPAQKEALENLLHGTTKN